MDQVKLNDVWRYYQTARCSNDTSDKDAFMHIVGKALTTEKDAVAKSPAVMAGYVADLEAFMTVVSSKLKCLPSFADPHPDEGNEHVIRKLDELLKRAT